MTDRSDLASSLVIDDLAPGDPDWRRLVSSADAATPVHDPTISRVAALTSGCRYCTLGAWRDGQLVGGVAVVVDGHGDVWPRSLAPYNGPLVVPMAEANPTTRYRHGSMIAGALLDELALRHRMVTVRMRPRAFDVRRIIESGWSLTSSFTYMVPISDLDRAWRSIDDNRRRLIRRAEREGCAVHETSGFSATVATEVNRLHLMMRDGYRTTTDLDADSWRVALHDLFDADLARLFLVSDADGEVVAFVLCTNTRPVSTLLATGADPTRLDSGAGALLRWRMFCELSASGVEQVDLNGARLGPEGRFKASFGGELLDRWELSSPQHPSATPATSRSVTSRMHTVARVVLGRSVEGG